MQMMKKYKEMMKQIKIPGIQTLQCNVCTGRKKSWVLDSSQQRNIFLPQV